MFCRSQFRRMWVDGEKLKYDDIDMGGWNVRRIDSGRRPWLTDFPDVNIPLL